MFVNRGIYHKGWTAVTRHSIPWVEADRAAGLRRRRLGAVRAGRLDPGPRPGGRTARQAARAPAPVPDRGRPLQRAPPRRPALRALQRRHGGPARSSCTGTSQLLYRGMGRLSENSVLVLKNKSHAVTAQLEVPEGGAEGVIVAQGGAYAGWSLYLHEGRPTYCYNFFGLQRFKVDGEQPVPRRRAPGTMEFAYDGGGLGQGRRRDPLRRRRQGRRGPGRAHRADDLLGRRDAGPGPRQRHAGQRRPRPATTRFTGRVRWVQLDIDEAAEDMDHLISARSGCASRWRGSSVTRSHQDRGVAVHPPQPIVTRGPSPRRGWRWRPVCSSR